MAAGPEQTRRKTIFGRFMQSLRERSQPKLTIDAVVKETETARTTITRMEGGYTVPGALLFKTLLKIYNATPEQRSKAEQLYETAKTDTTRIEFADDMPAKYRAFRRDEADAVRERTLDTVIIPGLLQTAAYAAAIRHGAHRLNRSTGDGSVATAERQSRQALLSRPGQPLQLHALIDEAAVRRMVGGPGVTLDQLDHLLNLRSWPNVTIQIVPFALGAYGPLSGPMILLSYDRPDEPDIAYLEYIAGGETVDNAPDVAALVAVWDEIAAAALSPDRSAEMISVIRTEVRRDED